MRRHAIEFGRYVFDDEIVSERLESLTPAVAPRLANSLQPYLGLASQALACRCSATQEKTISRLADESIAI